MPGPLTLDKLVPSEFFHAAVPFKVTVTPDATTISTLNVGGRASASGLENSSEKLEVPIRNVPSGGV